MDTKANPMNSFSESELIATIPVGGGLDDPDELLIHFDALADRCREVAQSDPIRVVIFDCHRPGGLKRLEAYRQTLCSNPVPLPGQGLLVKALSEIPQPVIAAIDGDAIGLGLEAVLACDIRIASERSRFGLPQIQEGTLPCFGGTQRLVRTVGKGPALEMLLTGEPIDAAEAQRIGLVNTVVPVADLKSAVHTMATTMSAKGPISLQYVKEAVCGGMELTLDQGLWLEADLYFLLHTTRDRSEGVRAFREKRKAQFQGN